MLVRVVDGVTLLINLVVVARGEVVGEGFSANHLRQRRARRICVYSEQTKVEGAEMWTRVKRRTRR